MLKFIVVLAAIFVVTVVASDDTVTIANGDIQGKVNEYGRIFRGVPFGKSNRWEASQPAPAWKPKVIQAFNDAPGCIQACNLPPHGCPPTTSEDCLFLNVVTPPVNRGQNLPVMVFIHGGNFKQGYAGGPLYDMQVWANRTNIVGVTIQYRLGSLGFLNANSDTMKGNFGIQDQQLALHWVQQNIAAFGGNPNNVTLFGQSAGAMSTAVHMLFKGSAGLFNRVIMQSEPFSLPFRTATEFKDIYHSMATRVGCPTDGAASEQCLRAAPVDKILQAQVDTERDVALEYTRLLQIFLPWTPTVGGGSELTDQPMNMFIQGKARDLPLIMGTVSNETLIFVKEAFGTPIKKIEYDVLLDVVFGLSSAKKIRTQYPLPPGTSADTRMNIVLFTTHCLFKCATRNVSRSLMLQQRQSPTYVYHYEHVLSFAPKVWGPNYSYCDDYTCHAGELPISFSPLNLGPALNITFQPSEVALGLAMQDYWSPGSAVGPTQKPRGWGEQRVTGGGKGGWRTAMEAMARAQQHERFPSLFAQSEAEPAWPPFNLENEPTMLLRTPTREVQYNAWTEVCDFWDKEIGYTYY